MTIFAVLVARSLVKVITAAATARVTFAAGAPTGSTGRPANLRFTHNAYDPRTALRSDDDHIAGGAFHGFTTSH